MVERLCHCETLDEAFELAAAMYQDMIIGSEANCVTSHQVIAHFIMQFAIFHFRVLAGEPERAQEIANTVGAHFATRAADVERILDEAHAERELVAAQPERNSKGVPMTGYKAFHEGWDVKSNPYKKDPNATQQSLDWVASWHVANAECFRDYVDGGNRDTIGKTQGNA